MEFARLILRARGTTLKSNMFSLRKITYQKWNLTFMKKSKGRFYILLFSWWKKNIKNN